MRVCFFGLSRLLTPHVKTIAVMDKSNMEMGHKDWSMISRVYGRWISSSK